MYIHAAVGGDGLAPWCRFSGWGEEWWTRQADKQTDRQLERSDDPPMQREIVRGWMVMEERAQPHRRIIRQAANAELLVLAANHSQTRSTSICHVCLRQQMPSCQSFIQRGLTGRLIHATCCVCVCVCARSCKLLFSTANALPIHD